MNTSTDAPRIEHDANGPFLRSYNATPDGQTETVYAVEAVYENRDTDYWNPSVTAHSDEDVRDLAQTIYRAARSGDYGAVLSIRQVSRQVTIRATEWKPANPSDES